MVMEGFDGEYYVFNQDNRKFVETDKVGAYALSLIDGKRRFKQIADAAYQRFADMGVSYEEISRKMTATFEAAMKIEAIRKKKIPW